MDGLKSPEEYPKTAQKVFIPGDEDLPRIGDGAEIDLGKVTKTFEELSPLRILLIILGAIFLAEVIAMVIVQRVQPLPFYLVTFLDAAIMTSLIVPVAYILIFRPLIRQIRERQKVETLLRNAQEGLASLVQERTRDLRESNTRLELASQDLAVKNELLELEVLERKQADDELRQAHDELELRVQQRTYQLERANQELQTEITERKQIEDEMHLQTASLSQSERLLKLVLETLPIGVWILDQEGKIVHGNSASQEIWAGARYVGMDQFGEYVGWWADSGKKIAAKEWAAARAIKNGETSLDEEIEIQCFDGTRKFILNSGVPIRDAQEKIIGAVIVNRDITKRRKAEEILTLEQAKLRGILDTMQDGVYIVNPDCDIEYINPIIEREFGSIEGRKCFQYFHERTEPCPWCKNQLVFTGKSVNWEWSSAKTGKTYDLFDTPLQNVDGSVSKLEIFHDITFRKRVEENLERSNLELKALSKAESKARQVAETLSEASMALSQTLNLEIVMATFLSFLKRLVPNNSAFIALMEGKDTMLVRSLLGFEAWIEPESLKNTALEASSIPDYHSLVSQRKPVLVNDIHQYPGWKPVRWLEWVRAWLGVPLIANDRMMGVCCLQSLQPGTFTKEHVRLAEALGGQAAVAIQNAWLFEQVITGRKRFQALSRRLVEIQEKERSFIARELHDEASQALNSLKLGLGFLERDAGSPEAVRNRAADLKGITDAVLDNLRRLAINLRPVTLDHVGLVGSLQQLTHTVSEQTGIQIQFKCIGSTGKRLPLDVETNLYRIVQEALTNAIKHSHATRVSIVLEMRLDKTVILIEDDGIGFDVEVIGKSGHLGLVGLQERVEMLGGSLEIESKAGTGTTVVVEVADGNPNFDRR